MMPTRHTVGPHPCNVPPTGSPVSAQRQQEREASQFFISSEGRPVARLHEKFEALQDFLNYEVQTRVSFAEKMLSLIQGACSPTSESGTLAGNAYYVEAGPDGVALYEHFDDCALLGKYSLSDVQFYLDRWRALLRTI